MTSVAGVRRESADDTRHRTISAFSAFKAIHRRTFKLKDDVFRNPGDT